MNIQQPELFVNYFPKVDLLDCLYKSLPELPYATDILGPMSRIAKKSAVGKVYIQANTSHCTKWLVFDIDRETAATDWAETGCPEPNIIVCNQANGHAHLFYGLEIPIFTKAPEHETMKLFAYDVWRKLNKKLGGDEAYNRILVRNPLHIKACVITRRDWLYNLYELNTYLTDIFFEKEKVSTLDPGAGRNCFIFDLDRIKAYRHRDKTKGKLTDEQFKTDIKKIVHEDNMNRLKYPLKFSEEKTIVDSIVDFTINVYGKNGYSVYNDNDREKSLQVRKYKAYTKIAKLKELLSKEPGTSNKAAARLLGIPKSSIIRYKKIIAEEK